MLKARTTEDYSGVIIHGPGEDIEELYASLYSLLARHGARLRRKGEDSPAATRLLAFCHSLSQAAPATGENPARGSGLSGVSEAYRDEASGPISFGTEEELPFDLSLEDEAGMGRSLEASEELEELEELEEYEGIEGFDEDYIDTGELDEAYEDGTSLEVLEELKEPEEPDQPEPLKPGRYGASGVERNIGLPPQLVCEAFIQWPELILVCLILKEYMEGSSLRPARALKQDLGWDPDWLTARRLQLIVLDSLCHQAGPRQAGSIRRAFMDRRICQYDSTFGPIHSLFSDYQTLKRSRRLSLLLSLPEKILKLSGG